MKTKFETEIGIEKKIIILTTKTVEYLLSKNPDSLSLYMFYIKNAKIQKTNSIFNVESFGMKGMGWGRDRYRSAKKILIDEKFIEDVVRRNDKGIILGHYLQINYIFTENKTDDTLDKIVHRVDLPTGGEEETNALSNKTINALSNKTYSSEEVKTTSQALEKKKTKKQLRLETPFSFESEMNRLATSGWKGDKIIHNYFRIKGFRFDNYAQFDTAYGRELKSAKDLQGYSAQQLLDTMNYCNDNYSQFNWSLNTVVKTIANIVNKNG